MKKYLLLVLSFFTITVNIAIAQTVYVTRTGTKYHVESCGYLSQSKIAIELKDAIARGYQPCKVCHPPNTSDISNQQQKIYKSYKPRSLTNNTIQHARVGCVCNDGTQSSATGRGACSHHGGVKYWLYN